MTMSASVMITPEIPATIDKKKIKKSLERIANNNYVYYIYG